MFITETDFQMSIKREVLEALIRSNPNILDAAILTAIQEMESYLRNSYDVATIFSAQGTNRNRLLLTFAIDIAIYHAYAGTDINVPEKRLLRYEAAIEWLKAVAKGTISVNLPLLDSEDTLANSVATFKVNRENYTL